MKKLFLVLPILAALPLQAAALPLQLFKERVREIETEPTRLKIEIPVAESGVDFPPMVTVERLAEINALFQAEGTFEGVDYASKQGSMWPTMVHLDYCRELAIGAERFPGQTQTLENCLKALDWWLTNQPRSPNWWSHEVYEDQMLGNIALLLPETAIQPELRERLVKKLERVKPGRTAQNRLWQSWNAFLAGLFLNDEAKVEEALAEMKSVITIAPAGQEGIQSDWSFHQHGPHFYQGNYGRHFLHSGSKYLRAVHGTPFEDAARTRIFERLLLDGTRRMCWGGLLDYATWGRQISYSRRIQGPDLRIVCQNLLAAAPERPEEIKAFMEELAFLPFSGPSKLPAGTFAFPKSDYLAHRTPDWLLTLKLASRRTIVTEGSGDNMKSDNFGQGQTYLYIDGTEYDKIFPVWDSACPPGTTALRIPMESRRHGRSTRGGDDFAAVSPEGAAGMRLRHGGVSANKSWFLYPDRIVCLGSDIASDAEGRVVTAIEQIHLKETPAAAEGETVRAIRHKTTTWLFPKDAPYLLETAERSGNWQDLRTANPDQEITAALLFLALDHGEKPQTGGYVYQILPKSDLPENPDAAWGDVKVIYRDAFCHAIQRGNEVRCVFFKPGSIKLPSGRAVVAEEPGIKVFRKGS